MRAPWPSAQPPASPFRLRLASHSARSTHFAGARRLSPQRSTSAPARPAICSTLTTRHLHLPHWPSTAACQRIASRLQPAGPATWPPTATLHAQPTVSAALPIRMAQRVPHLRWDSPSRAIGPRVSAPRALRSNVRLGWPLEHHGGPAEPPRRTAAFRQRRPHPLRHRRRSHLSLRSRRGHRVRLLRHLSALAA